MTKIYCHEYTFVAMNKERMGVQQVVVTIVTDKKDDDSFEAMELASSFIEQDMRIGHKLVIEGYLND